MARVIPSWSNTAIAVILEGMMTLFHPGSATAAPPLSPATTRSVEAIHIESLLKEARGQGDEAIYESWHKACETGDNFDACVKWLASRYYIMMRVRARERNPGKWGGSDKVMCEGNKASDALAAAYKEVRTQFPDQSPLLAEFYGDILYWQVGGHFAAAASMYYLAIKTNHALSDGVYRKLANCYHYMIVNSSSQLHPRSIDRQSYLVPAHAKSLSSKDIASWKVMETALRTEHPSVVFQSKDKLVQYAISVLDITISSPSAPSGSSTTRPGSTHDMRHVPATRPGSTDAIVQKLNSGDPAQVDNAVAQIREGLIATHYGRPTVISERVGFWYVALMDAKRYDDAAELSLLAAIKSAQNPDTVEVLMQQRVRALLDAGRKEDALIAAKSLYNVTSVGGIHITITNVFAAMAKIDKDAALQFSNNQFDTSIRQGAIKQVDLLRKVKVPINSYKESIAEAKKHQDFGGAAILGNLYLMADDSTEAVASFQNAYQLAKDDSERNIAVQGIARSLRAMDENPSRMMSFLAAVPEIGYKRAVDQFVPQPAQGK